MRGHSHFDGPPADYMSRDYAGAAEEALLTLLVMNALLSGVIAPLITGSLTVVALAALGCVIVGALLWAWHLADRSRRLVAAA